MHEVVNVRSYTLAAPNYLQHRTQVDAYIQARERLAAQIQAQVEAVNDPIGIRARLLARC